MNQSITYTGSKPYIRFARGKKWRYLALAFDPGWPQIGPVRVGAGDGIGDAMSSLFADDPALSAICIRARRTMDSGKALVNGETKAL